MGSPPYLAGHHRGHDAWPSTHPWGMLAALPLCKISRVPTPVADAPGDFLTLMGESMFRVTRELSFCYGHRLLGHSGKCRHLHGHNGRAVITLETKLLDGLGMVVDFGLLKEVIGGWINETIDHKMLLHRDDPLVPLLRQQGEPICTLDANPTAENIARMIFKVTAEKGFPVVEVQLWETDACCASYQGSSTTRE